MDKEPEADHSSDPSSRSVVWATYGSTEEDEDFIVGSAEGLRALRNHIDRAIEAGESRIEEPGIEFIGVRCKQSPRELAQNSTLAGIGCFAVVIGILVLAVYGAIALFS